MIRDVHYRFLLMYFAACIGVSTLFLAVVTTPAHAHQLDDPITVDSRNSTLDFPKTITFTITAHDSAANLTGATLYIRDNNNLNFPEQHGVDATTPGQSETFSWQEDLSKDTLADFPSPGTQRSYYWILQDANANRHTDTIQTFEVTDNRFNWQHLSQGKYQVNWYNQDITFGQSVLNQVVSNAQRISNNLGGSATQPINLWIYTDDNDFKSSLPPGMYEWVGGIAFPGIDQAEIVVNGLDDFTLQRDMPHELTHLIFHQLVSLYIVPLWFDEGMAVYNQTYHEPEMLATFRDAQAKHSLLSLDTISRTFPANADTAYLAYAQSWQLLSYMYQTFGQDKMHTLIKLMNSGEQTFNADVKQAFGEDMDQLEDQWLTYLGQPTTQSSTNQPTANNNTGPVDTKPTSITTDTTALTVLGLLLIFIPLFGFGGALVYVYVYSNKRRKARLQVQFPVTPGIEPGQAQLPRSPTPQIPQTPHVHVGNYASPEAYLLPSTPPVVAQPQGEIVPGTSMPKAPQAPQQPYHYPPGAPGYPGQWYPPYPPQEMAGAPIPPPQQPYPAEYPPAPTGPQYPQAPQE